MRIAPAEVGMVLLLPLPLPHGTHGEVAVVLLQLVQRCALPGGLLQWSRGVGAEVRGVTRMTDQDYSYNQFCGCGLRIGLRTSLQIRLKIGIGVEGSIGQEQGYEYIRLRIGLRIYRVKNRVKNRVKRRG